MNMTNLTQGPMALDSSILAVYNSQYRLKFNKDPAPQLGPKGKKPLTINNIIYLKYQDLGYKHFDISILKGLVILNKKTP